MANQIKYFKKNYEYYVMLIPAIAFYIIFKYAPLYGILIAFQDYNFMIGVFHSPWIGLDVFRDVMHNATFWTAFRNTLLLNILCLIIQFPLPIIFALLVNEINGKRYKRLIQTVSYMPHFISWAIVYGLLLAFLDKNVGLINLIIKLFGAQGIEFLTHKGWWITIFVSSGIWKEMGWSAIIYMAALSSIDTSLYEAAGMDGANRFRKMWHVTLPGIKSTIVIILILNVGQIMSIGFEQPYLFGNALVSDISSVLSTYIYDRGLMQAQFSYATAVGLFQQIINYILLYMASYSARMLGEGGILGGEAR